MNLNAYARKSKELYLRCRNKTLRLLLSRLLPLDRGARLVRIGSVYGGWFVPESALRGSAVCYSVGLGEDGSFDRAMAEIYGCQVFVFDPTPRAIEYAQAELADVPGIRFQPLGLWSEQTVLRFYAPRNPAHVSHSVVNLQGTTDFFEAQCVSLADAMDALGHRRIDILKLDVEGAEYEVLNAMLAAALEVDVVCVEFDQPTPFAKTLRQIRDLRRSGYSPIAIEGWNLTFQRHVDGAAAD
ncbi:MAG TPA: FkbM family methyltransferase [Mycobacterium sp.]|nr:FkbM family methyltransferase [Mycobacterium sp.]